MDRIMDNRAPSALIIDVIVIVIVIVIQFGYRDKARNYYGQMTESIAHSNLVIEIKVALGIWLSR